MKLIYIILIFIFFSAPSFGQFLDKLYIEADFTTMFSVGEPKSKTIDYKPGITASVPKISKFNNPVNGLNFNLIYKVNNHFALGIGSGISIVKFEKNPVIGNEYFDRVSVPFYLRLGYQRKNDSNWTFLSDLNSGYQYYDFRFGNTDEGFYFQETGGLLINLNVGIGKKIYRFTPILKIGYELNQFSHNDSLGWIENMDLTFDDRINYKSYYHLLKFSISVRL